MRVRERMLDHAVEEFVLVPEVRVRWYNVSGVHEGLVFGGIENYGADPTEWVPMHQNFL